MLHMSRKFLSAIEAVVDIAYHAEAQPVRHCDITRRQGIPKRYLEQVLQQLVRSDILVGVRGPYGGYRLARERRRITVGHICRAISHLGNGESANTKINESSMGQHVIVPLWKDIDQRIINRLDGITIESLCHQAKETGVVRENAPKTDFSI